MCFARSSSNIVGGITLYGAGSCVRTCRILSQWFSRVLKRHHWTIRKTTVSQKVPTNWHQIAHEDSNRITRRMKEAGVDVLINADQPFFLFYPEDQQVIAPIGTKRVGSTIQIDEKKGCTVMGAMELFSSSLLPPFIVLQGAPNGTLHKQWLGYEGPAYVTFQKKHWFDKFVMMEYCDFVKGLYPDKKIGIILDRSSIHTSPETVNYMEQLGFTVEFIHAGMTSVEQPCDIFLNRTAKGIVRDLYYRYRSTLKLQPGSKCPVTREHLVKWVEQAFAKVDADHKMNRKIAHIFKKCGMDPYDEGKQAFTDHLAALTEDSIYFINVN